MRTPVLIAALASVAALGACAKQIKPPFDPGVCSRSGWTVSSRDVELVVQFEQRMNDFERFVGKV